MNSMWEAAKRNPFMTAAHCEAKMGTDNQLVANRNIAAADAGKISLSSLYCMNRIKSRVNPVALLS